MGLSKVFGYNGVELSCLLNVSEIFALFYCGFFSYSHAYTPIHTVPAYDIHSNMSPIEVELWILNKFQAQPCSNRGFV